MSKFFKLLALGLALVMVLSFVACTQKPNENSGAASGDESKPAVSEDESKAPEIVPQGTVVYATSTFDQKFSPFFYTTACDADVVNLVSGYLLASDRGGAVVETGIEGKTVTYNGTDYTYYGFGDVEVIQNNDGSVDYKLTMRDNIKFSDGTPATIDDVIFGIYVMCDPTYDGSSTIYALPIEGMDEYRAGVTTLLHYIYGLGRENTDFTNVTEEQQKAFWEKYDKATLDLAKEIYDYCVAKGYAEDGDIQAAAGAWGFDAEENTLESFAAALEDVYGDDVAKMISTENAGSSVEDLFPGLEEYSQTAVTFGESAANIKGIQRTGDYTMTVHMTSFDAVAIYDMGFVISPLHYYGNKDEYDYAANKFGFTKGDLSSVRAKTTQPLGCGAFTYEGYDKGVVTLKANTSYVLGTPHIETLQFAEGVDSEYVPGIQSGKFDVASPSISDKTVAAIKGANSNKELVGETITTYLIDYRGYGYIGINADLVNIDKDPSSDKSKALRKGFMTLFSVYRDTVINSYYGERASVIQYPISNTSWAAPQPADEGYKIAYSTDVNGKAIYTDAMTEEQKFAAALEAAIGYFKAAGFTYDEAAKKFTGVEQTWEIMIPGQGEQDHPAYNVATSASKALESIGIKLQVNDVVTSVWSNSLNTNTAMMWAAAWQASVDPDMTQVYHSKNAHGQGTNSNHYQVDDDKLDELIEKGRASADTEYRKATYKQAMEIILDWGCELPLYQRKECTTFSTERVVIDTVPKDMTPFWGWAAEIENLEAVVAK